MFRTEPIPTIQNAQQMSVGKMSVCYSYSTNGIQSNQATISFYGLTKSGKKLIASATLDTDAGYVAYELASCLIIGVPIEEFPYVTWEITKTSGSNLVAIHGQPQILLSVNGGVDHVDPSTTKKATRA